MKFINKPDRQILLIFLSIFSTVILGSRVKGQAIVTPERGYSVTLLNDNLAGPVEFDFDIAGNIYVANEGKPNVFLFEDFISKLAPNGETIAREFIDGLEDSSGLAVDEHGNIYVSQDVELPLRKYNSNGEPVLVFNAHRPHFSDPNTLALTNDGRLLAAAGNFPPDGKWRILAFDIKNGNRLPDFTLEFPYEFVNSIVFKDGQLFIAGTPASDTGLGPLLVAQEAEAPTAYPFNYYAKWYLNGLAVGSLGEIYGTNFDELLKIHSDGSVSLLAQGFEFARGVKERDGCVFVSEFRQGSNGSLYRVCPDLKVKIDIKPGSFPNSINPKSKGKIPVAILTNRCL